MTAPGTGRSRPDEPLDGTDAAVLAELRSTFDTADPAPPELSELVRFAVSLEDLEAEVGRMSELAGTGSAARGGATRSITFDGDTIAVVISVSAAGDTEVRVDGWVAPAGSYQAELRTGADRLHTTSDEQGRFAFSRVARGAVQLLVAEHLPTGPGRSMITPAVVV